MLPGYLDSYAVVIERKANTLVVSEEAEWAERLRDAVTRVLRDTLSQHLGASRVLLRGEHRVADAELVIEFLKLDPSNGALELDARWTFVCTARERPAHTGRTESDTARVSNGARRGGRDSERAGQFCRGARQSNVVWQQRGASKLKFNWTFSDGRRESWYVLAAAWPASRRR